MIFKFFGTLFSYVTNIFNSFVKFMIDNNLVNLFMAAIIGLALSNLIGSIKVNLLDYYINKLFKTTNNNLINLATSFLQFILIVLILYFLYNHFLKKISERFHSASFNEIKSLVDI